MPTEKTEQEFWYFVQATLGRLKRILESAKQFRDKAPEIKAFAKQQEKAHDQRVNPPSEGDSPDETRRKRKEAETTYWELNSKIRDHYSQWQQVGDSFTRILGELQQPWGEHGQAQKILSRKEAEGLILTAGSGLPLPYDIVIRNIEELIGIVEDFANSNPSAPSALGAPSSRVVSVKSQAVAVAIDENDQEEDLHLNLLEAILQKKRTTLEKWAKGHKSFGRSTVFEWKKLRKAGKSLQGEVSPEKNAQIEAAIENDAKALGLVTRTPSD